jgi:hypothetical protein
MPYVQYRSCRCIIVLPGDAGRQWVFMRNEATNSGHTELGRGVTKMNIILRQGVPSTDFTNDRRHPNPWRHAVTAVDVLYFIDKILTIS